MAVFFRRINSPPDFKMKQFNHGQPTALREYQRPLWVQTRAARWPPGPPAALGRVLHAPLVCLKTLNSRYIDRLLLISNRFPTDALRWPPATAATTSRLTQGGRSYRLTRGARWQKKTQTFTFSFLLFLFSARCRSFTSGLSQVRISGIPSDTKQS